MKIKNKKKFNIIIAAFMTVFMVGAAFAFAAQSNLVFQGTSNVDAILRLEITQADPAHGFSGGAHIDPGNRRAVFYNDFYAMDQRARFNFEVTNTGTLPAVFDGVSLENAWYSLVIDGVPADYLPYGINPVITFYVEIGGNWAQIADGGFPTGVVLQPEDTFNFMVQLSFLEPGHGHTLPLSIWALQGTFATTLTLEYAAY
jgi:hypothetical protein